MTHDILIETQRLFPDWADKTIKNKRADFFERTDGTPNYRLERHQFIEFLKNLTREYAKRGRRRR